MDSQLFRLNHMSYQHQQHILNQQQQQQQQKQQRAPNSRQHYSNRQQAVGANQTAAARIGTSASSGSDQDEQVQLSSLSTATNKTNGSAGSTNSQAAILGANSGQNRAHNSQQQQQPIMSKQQQQQHRQQQHQAGAGHRQAALQMHNLTVPGHGNKSAGAVAAERAHKMAASDQLTSSSNQTIDDLHHLAPHHQSFGGGAHRSQHHHHHLTAARAGFDSSQSSTSAGAGGSQSGSRFLLGILFTIAELLLFASVLLWLYWAYQHDDGLAWQSDRKQQFNTHAALMLFGFIFLSGQAMLIHRSFSCCSKIYTKILHTILFVLATSAISLGLILAYTAQENVGANNKPIMHFYSLHAWCGLTTVGLFVFQFVFGFVSFLILLCCDQATANYRAALLPIHKTFGLIIFSLAIATCLTGLLQTARSRLR
jgi:cytochrome b561